MTELNKQSRGIGPPPHVVMNRLLSQLETPPVDSIYNRLRAESPRSVVTPHATSSQTDWKFTPLYFYRACHYTLEKAVLTDPYSKYDATFLDLTQIDYELSLLKHLALSIDDLQEHYKRASSTLQTLFILLGQPATFSKVIRLYDRYVTSEQQFKQVVQKMFVRC